MSEFLLGSVLQNTFLAAGIALLALLAARFLPRRPGIAHTLWILVLLKLITPPFWTVALWPAAPVEAVCPSRILEGEVPARPVLPPVGPPSPGPTEHTTARWSWSDGLALIALLGTLTYVGMAVSRLLRLRRLLRRLPEGEPLPELATLADSLGVAPPRVRWSRESLPPLLLALGTRPTLVLPVMLWQSLGGAERRALLLHELAHLARGDHQVRRLELIVLALYWWNPLVWFACGQLRRAEELCCDALVIATRPEIAPAYANALIETLAYLAGHPTTLPAEASGAGPVVDIRRRLGMILQNKSPHVGRGGLLMALLAIALLCPLVPTRAEPKVPDTVEALIATQKSCQQCHTPEKPGRPDLPRLHDDVVRLMEEIRRARHDLEQREAKVRELLREFEKQNTLKPDRTEETIRSMEQQIRALQEQLELLRKRPSNPSGVQPLPAPLPHTNAIPKNGFVNSQHFQIPIRVEAIAKDKELKVFSQTSESKKWDTTWPLKPGQRHLNVAVTQDGTYLFTVAVASDAPPLQPVVRVVVDTKPPEVSFKGRRTAKTIDLEWEASDRHLADDGINLEYRDARGEWRHYRTLSLGEINQLSIQRQDTDALDWRLNVRDQAGNTTTKTLSLE